MSLLLTRECRQALEFGRQRSSLKTQHLCGGFLIAFGFLQSLLQDVALNVVDGLFKVEAVIGYRDKGLRGALRTAEIVDRAGCLRGIG